jgi:hypothetical protein
MDRKKIKLEEKAISEILVADTASELGVEAMIQTSLRKNKKKNNDSKPQQKSPEQTLASEPKSAAVCSSCGQRHSAPDVTWACEWCLVAYFLL